MTHGDEGHEQAVLNCGGAFVAGGDLAAELAHADLEVGVVADDHAVSFRLGFY